MATTSKASEMADHYIEALAGWAEVTRKPLFGAIALRRNDLVFGMGTGSRSSIVPGPDLPMTLQ